VITLQFTAGTSKGERLIMKLQKLPFSHVSLVVDHLGEISILETHPKKGVVIKDWVPNSTRKYKDSKLSYTNIRVGRMIDECKEMQDEQLGYNYAGVLGHGIRLLTGFNPNRRKRFDAFNCAQFVAYMLWKYYGMEAFRDFNRVSINDLYNSPYFGEIRDEY
jgi:hypothetical protein